MTVRADHVAGAAFVAFGAIIIAISGDLPTGRLSMPGSGFMPKLIAGLMILLGFMLFIRAKESGPLADLGWSDGRHAILVLAISSLSIFFYTELGFIVTLTLMIFGLLVVIERRNPLIAAGYSIGVVLVTFVAFQYLLKTPMPKGPLGF